MRAQLARATMIVMLNALGLGVINISLTKMKKLLCDFCLYDMDSWDDIPCKGCKKDVCKECCLLLDDLVLCVECVKSNCGKNIMFD